MTFATMLRWTATVVVSGVLAAVAAGCQSKGATPEGTSAPSGEAPINVRTLLLQRGTLAEYVTVSGPLRPIRGADVSTEESGVVREIPNDRGQQVEAGDELILLDRRLLAAEMRATEAGRDLAEHNKSRNRKLFEAKQISRQEMLRIESESASARARADVARARWERAAVKAPFPGIVSARYAELGEFVAAGTPVARVVDPYTLEVRGAVSEREAVYLREGARAAVTMDGASGVLEGRLHWISVEAATKTGKFPVEIRVNNADFELRPGIVARAEILKQRHEDVVIIPRDAILMQADGAVAFVVEDGHTARRRLSLGADQGLMVVVESGLSTGEQLVVRGQRQLREGSPVAVREEATAPDGSIASDPIEIRGSEAFSPLIADEPREPGAESTP